MAAQPLVIGDLTDATLDGQGVFDVLMRANKAHLEAEFSKNRIKGPEYSTVYLGSLESVLEKSVMFLLNKDKASLEAKLIEAQILKIEAEMALFAPQLLKINAEVALLGQQLLNSVEEGNVLRATVCKLEAEFDLIVEQRSKSAQETALLLQKVATEKAQTQGLGVDADSVIGKQKKLYEAQAEGFVRDAEQKAADIMTKTWSVRRTTDSGTEANVDNKLNDLAVGRAIEKLLEGVSA